MRLKILCQDRVGIAQEVLSILVKNHINLLGIEIREPGRVLFIRCPDVDFHQLQQLMPEIRKIKGIEDVRKVDFMPGEREHFELKTLLTALPDPVLSIDTEGKIIIANQSATNVLDAEQSTLQGSSLSIYLPKKLLSKIIEDLEEPKHGIHLPLKGQNYIADIMPIRLPKAIDDEQPISELELPNTATEVIGAVINLTTPLRIERQAIALQEEQQGFEHIFCQSKNMTLILKQAKRMASLDAPLLVVGETGTGKELIARACHLSGPRREKPFLALNCAAIPDEVAESELFGHGTHAFGAQANEKRGLLEQAHGGTVFLDEVGDMSLSLQNKLLRFLNDGSFRRVGDEEEKIVNVRIICSTQKDLPRLCQEGKFREDLYYRLNVLSLVIPPLRERSQEIIPMALHFITHTAMKLGLPTPKLSNQSRKLLLNYQWPGNVRQLENAVFRSVSMLESDTIEPQHLKLPSYTQPLGYLDYEFNGTLDEAVKRFEKSLLERLYPAYPSTRQLAKKLGVSHTAIANKLREYKIQKPKKTT